MFQVGDIVKGKKSFRYSITNESMTAGYVYSCGYDGIRIVILEHKDNDYVNRVFTGLESQYFEKTAENKYTKSVLEKKLIMDSLCKMHADCNKFYHKNIFFILENLSYSFEYICKLSKTDFKCVCIAHHIKLYPEEKELLEGFFQILKNNKT